MTKEYFPTFTEVNPFNELSDYITKSPPKEKMNNALYRWCMRWFVIYFRRASGKCWLLYYQNEDAYREGKEAKGTFTTQRSANVCWTYHQTRSFYKQFSLMMKHLIRYRPNF